MVRRLVAIAIGAMLGLGLVEIAGRVVGYLPPRPSPAYVKLTSAVGWLPEPGSRLVYGRPGGEYHTVVRFNALGFRSEAVDFPPPRGPDDRRVLVLGDSYASAWQVPLEERWSERMTALRPGWTAINTGVPTWGTDQEYLTFAHYPLGSEPDVALLMVFPGNDPSDTARLILTGVPPLYPHFVADGPIDGFASLRLANDWVYANPFDAPAGVDAWLRLHSVVRRAASDASALVSASAAPKAAAARDDPRAFDVFRDTGDPKWDAAWRLTDALLAQMQTDAARRGIRLVVVLVPYYGTVQPELRAATLRATPAAFDLGRPYRRYAEIARAHGIPLLDLTDGFVAFHAGTPGDLFYPEDKHFTPLGNCVAGMLVTAWLDPTSAASADVCRR
jgi:hypothetical protein